MNILVLEDDRHINNSIAVMLKQNDKYNDLNLYQCFNYDDYEKVKKDVVFDIGILDININSRESGVDIGKELMEDMKSDILFLSSSFHQNVLEEIKQIGQVYTLAKPFTSKQVSVIFDLFYAKRIQIEKNYNNEEVIYSPLIDFYKSVIDKTCLVSVTNSKGIIIEANPEFCKLSGYSEDELKGKTHSIVNSGYHDKEFFKEMWDVLLNGEVWSGEVCNIAKNGKLYWVQSQIIPLKTESGQIVKYFSIRQDITEKKFLELEHLKLLKLKTNELHKSQNDLIKLSKISSINTMTTNIAHDIRGPLTNISLILDLIREDYQADTSKKSDLFDRAQTKIKTAVDIIENIYAVLKKDPNQLEYKYNVFDTISKVSSIIFDGYNNQFTNFEIINNSNSIENSFDYCKEHFEQGILNLLQNSLKATNLQDNRSSKITITIDETLKDIIIIIKDNGIGIEKEQISKIFNPGVSNTGGAGVGLSLVKSGITNAGGEIKIDSELGEWTTFTINLPKK